MSVLRNPSHISENGPSASIWCDAAAPGFFLSNFVTQVRIQPLWHRLHDTVARYVLYGTHIRSIKKFSSTKTGASALGRRPRCQVRELPDYIVGFQQIGFDKIREACFEITVWCPNHRSRAPESVSLSMVPQPGWFAVVEKSFTDLSRPPASHAKYPTIWCPQVVAAADREEGGWIPAFSRYALHGFSPITETLHVEFGTIPPIPLLEDAAVITRNGIAEVESLGGAHSHSPGDPQWSRTPG